MSAHLTNPWADYLESADEALEDGDLATAVQWAQVAQAHALASIAETLRDREVRPAWILSTLREARP